MDEPRAARRVTLLRELLVRIGGVMLVLLAAAGALSYLLARHYSSEVHDRWLSDSARSLANELRFDRGQPRLDLPTAALDMLLYDEHDRIYYEVRDATGARVAGNASVPAPGGADLAGQTRFGDATIEGRPVRTATVDLDNGGGGAASVGVAETLNKRDALTKEILLELVPLHLALVLAGVLSLYWALRSGLRALSQTAAAIRARDPRESRPVAPVPAPPVEVQPLVDAINDLLARIDAAQRAQQRFLANAAHQLRTPVASLEMQVERALREPDERGRTEALASVASSVRRLGRVLHQLLTLSRLEPDATASVAMRRCDLARIAREVVERQVDAAIANGADIGYEGPVEGVFVDGEPTLIAEMLRNLVENALTHGGPRGRVTVGLADDPPRAFVEDEGPGIPPGERERVFERFYRGAAPAGAGSGLGLAIVREIAERHGAGVSLATGAAGAGTRATIAFPHAGEVSPVRTPSA